MRVTVVDDSRALRIIDAARRKGVSGVSEKSSPTTAEGWTSSEMSSAAEKAIMNKSGAIMNDQDMLAMWLGASHPRLPIYIYQEYSNFFYCG